MFSTKTCVNKKKSKSNELYHSAAVFFLCLVQNDCVFIAYRDGSYLKHSKEKRRR